MSSHMHPEILTEVFPESVEVANVCPFFLQCGNDFYLHLLKVLFKVKDAITLNDSISGSALMGLYV